MAKMLEMVVNKIPKMRWYLYFTRYLLRYAKCFTGTGIMVSRATGYKAGRLLYGKN